MKRKSSEERMFSTSIQLTFRQMKQLDEIIKVEDNKKSNAEILRDAFDFYVAMRFPKLTKI